VRSPEGHTTRDSCSLLVSLKVSMTHSPFREDLDALFVNVTWHKVTQDYSRGEMGQKINPHEAHCNPLHPSAGTLINHSQAANAAQAAPQLKDWKPVYSSGVARQRADT
jgi:hypothetical protein